MPTDGPERNLRLTALTGAVLLVLLAVEGFTLLSLRAMLSWHIFVGILLVPVVLLKLGSTGYRFFRYYTHRPDYVRAGPPPLLLRLLGPVVVLSTLALLATGIALIAVGPGRGLVLAPAQGELRRLGRSARRPRARPPAPHATRARRRPRRPTARSAARGRG